ncbi:hypothetical protein RDWZM_002977 [Blomia tropicalis]|uniref:Uncharacterized protein n=1 Tax=Blomia tropicalis TaxID=40697 RepID=A0A9Q0MH99_BLOTA|nr:hypothetical protein RDWZM_002977 [Blomia tropicalis]
MNNHEIDHHQTQIEQPKIFEQKSRQLRPLPKRQPQQQQQQQQQQKYQSKPTYKTEEQFIYRPAHYFSDDPNDPNRNRHRLNNNNNKSPKYVIEKHGKSRSNKPIQMINDVNEDEDDSLPAMFPQLANVINQYNSEQSDQSMGGRQQLDTNHVRSKSNQPRFTATTTRSAPTPPKMMMENPRIYTKPMYDQRVMPTRPQLNYRPINQYETNIESPPKSTEPYSFDGSPSRSIVKDPSSDALSFYLSSIQGDSQPPPQTPSSINDEVYNLNSFSVKTSHPNRQRTSPSTSMKFDPSNSVRAGPNTFMSLRFEPSNDDENKQNNNSPSNKFYTSQQRSQPQLDPNRITYRTQTVNSIEDQQQRPTRNHYESRHVMSPNKYNPAPLASINFRQRKAVKNEDAKPETGRAQVYSYFHTFPTNNDESKVKTKQTKTQLKKVDVKPQDSKYQNKYRQPQAKNRQNYKSKPKNDRINQYNGNQASASEMMSNTVKPNKFNWKLNVQRYAKEFGFQLPPSLAEQNFELQSANEEPILSSPLEIEQKQSRNQIPMASNPSYQATNLNNDSSMVRYYYDIVNHHQSQLH